MQSEDSWRAGCAGPCGAKSAGLLFQADAIDLPTFRAILACGDRLQAGSSAIENRDTAPCEEQQNVSLKDPFLNKAPYIITGMDLASGRPVLVKLLPVRSEGERRKLDAELLAVRLLRLETLPAESSLVPTKRLPLPVSEQHAENLGVEPGQPCDALQMPWYPMDLAALPFVRRLPSALLFKGGRILVAALEIMHSVGAVHCDVKAENVFVDQDGRWRLGDYGSLTPVGKPIWSYSRRFYPANMFGEPATPEFDWGLLVVFLAVQLARPDWRILMVEDSEGEDVASKEQVLELCESEQHPELRALLQQLIARAGW